MAVPSVSDATKAAEVSTVRGMTSEDYHQHPYVSRSGIKLFRENREAYYEVFEARTRKDDSTTDNLIFGVCLHTLALDGVDNTVIAIPDSALTSNGQRRGKAWNAFKAECNERGLTPLFWEEIETLKHMVAALQKHPRAKELLYGDDAVVEESIFWQDVDTGLWLRVRPDVRRNLGYFRAVVDLKSAADVSAEGFAYSATKFAYDIQHYLYKQGVKAATGEDHAFTFVVVEKEWPFRVRCYELDEEYERLAESKTRLALEQIAKCRLTNNWMPVGWDTIQAIQPPYKAKFANQWEYAE